MAAPAAKFDALANEIDRLRAELRVPGLSIAIAEHKKTELATGLGLGIGGVHQSQFARLLIS